MLPGTCCFQIRHLFAVFAENRCQWPVQAVWRDIPVWIIRTGSIRNRKILQERPLLSDNFIEIRETGYSCAGPYGFGHVCLIFRKFWLCAWKERADRELFYIIYWKCRFSWHLLPCMNIMRDWFFEEFAGTVWTDSMEFHWEAGILKMFRASWLRLTGRLRMKKEGRGYRNYKYYCKKRPGFQ